MLARPDTPFPGQRYLDLHAAENAKRPAALKFAADLKEWITEERPYLTFEEADEKYEELLANRFFDLRMGALLGCNDRFFLLAYLLNRPDARHPWLYERCREVEEDPDGHCDLWSRFHYKSTIITFAGAIQAVMCKPEITIAIFSVVKPIAQAFLGQIKEEFENNETLKACYSDVLYQNPRTIGPDGRPAKWGLARGITVKRKANPKEATVEAHGLIDGQPTSRHYDLHIYDDVVHQDYLSEDSIRKTTERWELADNLGSHLGVRKWVVGTRYHHADTYGVMIDRKSLKPRIHPATQDGTLEGEPVFLTQERWDEIKRDQRSTVSAQCLLNPIAGNEATFKPQWFKTYEVIPAMMNVYILCDPSKGSSQRSDRTAIVVIGIDQGGNKYLLDGVRHRMKLSQRWEFIKAYKRYWEGHNGVQMVKIGYERYGMQTDLEVIEDMQLREDNHFPIEELNTPRQGGHSKEDRIGRLEPDIRSGRFLLPLVVYNPDLYSDTNKESLSHWFVWGEVHDKEAAAAGVAHSYRPGQLVYRPLRGMTKRQREVRSERVVRPLKRRDENGELYDLTRVFLDEAFRHPFAQHDDLIDAASRIYDIDPQIPTVIERQSTEPIGLESIEAFEAGFGEEVIDA